MDNWERKWTVPDTAYGRGSLSTPGPGRKSTGDPIRIPTHPGLDPQTKGPTITPKDIPAHHLPVPVLVRIVLDTRIFRSLFDVT